MREKKEDTKTFIHNHNAQFPGIWRDNVTGRRQSNIGPRSKIVQQMQENGFSDSSASNTNPRNETKRNERNMISKNAKNKTGINV